MSFPRTLLEGANDVLPVLEGELLLLGQGYSKRVCHPLGKTSNAGQSEQSKAVAVHLPSLYLKSAPRTSYPRDYLTREPNSKQPSRALGLPKMDRADR